MTSIDFSPYYLTDNPFPEIPVIDVESNDIRVNGTIFSEDAFKNEVPSLTEKVSIRTNMVYVCGLQFERGLGKSALLSYVWRQLRNDKRFITAFVRCTPSPPANTPAGFCTALVSQLHKEGYLWEAFRRLLFRYADDRRSPALTRASLETMFTVLTWPLDKVPLRSYTHIDPYELTIGLGSWMQDKCHCGQAIASMLGSTYLTEPKQFPQKFATSRSNKIEMYGSILNMIVEAGFEWSFFFLDQMEDPIMVTPTRRMGGFTFDLRRMLELSSGKASIIGSLHPDSETKLDVPVARRNLEGIALVDAKHRVDVMRLDKRGDEAVKLASQYISHFRQGDAPTATYPFDPLVIRYVCFLEEGNIRNILKQLYECLKFGALQREPLLNMDFVLEQHTQTLGRDLNKDKYEDFKRGMA